MSQRPVSHGKAGAGGSEEGRAGCPCFFSVPIKGPVSILYLELCWEGRGSDRDYSWAPGTHLHTAVLQILLAVKGHHGFLAPTHHCHREMCSLGQSSTIPYRDRISQRLGSCSMPYCHQAVTIRCCIKSRLLFVWMLKSGEGKRGMPCLPIVIEVQMSGAHAPAWCQALLGCELGETGGRDAQSVADPAEDHPEAAFPGDGRHRAVVGKGQEGC